MKNKVGKKTYIMLALFAILIISTVYLSKQGGFREGFTCTKGDQVLKKQNKCLRGYEESPDEETPDK